MDAETVLAAEANGITVAFSDTETGEPLLILQGGAGKNSDFRRFVPYLDNRIRIISYDQRDFGGTAAGNEPYSLKTLTDDAVGLMDALGLARAHLMGCSYGGMVALQVGVHHRDRVQSLIVGSAPYRYEDLASSTGDLTGLSPEEQMRHVLEIMLSPEGQADGDLVAEVTDVVVSGESARKRVVSSTTGARRLAAIAEYDMTGLGKEITAPTLLIYGRDDPIGRPDFGRQLNQEIPNSRLVILENRRHAFFRESPAEVAKLMSDWVFNHPIGDNGHL